jgi:hypothetical protein
MCSEEEENLNWEKRRQKYGLNCTGKHVRQKRVFDTQVRRYGNAMEPLGKAAKASLLKYHANSKGEKTPEQKLGLPEPY